MLLVVCWCVGGWCVGVLVCWCVGGCDLVFLDSSARSLIRSFVRSLVVGVLVVGVLVG